MTLDQWRREQNLNYQKTAERLAVAHEVARRYCKGRVPAPAAVVRIYVVTGGAVEPNDFYDLPELR